MKRSCAVCGHIAVINKGKVYAVCTRSGGVFFSFQQDTRSSCCTEYQPGQPAKSEESEALKKALRAERLRFAHLMADAVGMAMRGERPCRSCDGHGCVGCTGYDHWVWINLGL